MGFRLSYDVEGKRETEIFFFPIVLINFFDVSFSVRERRAYTWRARQVAWQTKTEKESLFHVQEEGWTYW